MGGQRVLTEKFGNKPLSVNFTCLLNGKTSEHFFVLLKLKWEFNFFLEALVNSLKTEGF